MDPAKSDPELVTDVDFGDEPAEAPVTRTVPAAFSSGRPHPADEEYQPPTPTTWRASKPEPYKNGSTPHREIPHSDEVEAYLISCCFIDPADVMPRCEAAQITPASFFDPNRGDVFKCVQGVWRRTGGVDIAVVGEELRRSGALETIGGWAFLTQVSALLPTSIQASSLIETVKQYATRREIIRLAARAADGAHTEELADLLSTLEFDLKRLAGGPTASPLVALPDFTVPADNDASVLLGNRYLNRGDGAVLVGTSGMGKSSMSIQMATLFALGRPAFGIPPNGPLRSLIVQSEDSEGDVAEMWASINHVLQLPADRQQEVRSRVKIQTERVLRGDRFLAQLRRTITQFKPDLVWINPLQAFIDGDVTDSQDLGRFLREGLNGINPSAFGYVLVHHTTKPATGKEKTERLWHEVMYDMAGGAEIINWARAILSLRASAKEGEFNLVLAKRGRRAGVTRAVAQGVGTRLEPVTTLPLRHAQGFIPAAEVGLRKDLPIIFWESRDPDAKPGSSETRGRPEKYSFSDYKNIFPAHDTPGMEISPLRRRLAVNKDIATATLHNCLKRWAEEGTVEIITPPGAGMRYRMAF